MLRLGCCGCLTGLVLLALVSTVGWVGFQALGTPDIAGQPTSAADGVRAQQKIFDILRGTGGAGGSRRARSVSLSERELNAFLSRHLSEAADLPLAHVGVRLPSDGRAEVGGQLPLGQLASLPIPTSWLDRGIWLTIRARVTLEGNEEARDRRHLRLDVERFWIGRLRVPELMLRVLLDPTALRLLRWPTPESIDGLRIEPGRIIIQTAA